MIEIQREDTKTLFMIRKTSRKIIVIEPNIIFHNASNKTTNINM